MLRRHLVPRPGHAFVSGDYAAFEPRLLADRSADPVLREGSRATDLYEYLMPMLGVTERDVMKLAVLAFLNEQQDVAFALACPLPTREGFRIHAELTSLLEEAVDFRRDVVKVNRDVARSTAGWPRYRGAEDRRTFQRRAFNLVMQGFAGDLMRRLLRDLKDALPPDARVCHQEFDAVIVTCPAPAVAQVEAILRTTMENVAALSIPLLVKTKHGATLADVS